MNKNLIKLEFDKIQFNLSQFAVTYIGKEQALNLLPSNNKEIVKNLLSETEEAEKLLFRNSTPPLDEIADNTITIKALESFGTLSIKSILEITKILQMSNDLKNYFFVEHINPEDFYCLNKIFSELYTNKSILDKIKICIIDENNISDKASTRLASIRKKQRTIEQDIKNKLNHLLHSYSKYLQENVITIRNDRYVIPVKDEYRSQIKGFVHDISSSGSTVFIEPIAIFELNNELANLKIEENLEIEKILQELSKLFYPYTEELKQDIKYIGELDFIFAKAKYSKSLHAITPKISDKKEIILNQAKHPLLNQDIAVPISVSLGQNFNTLVITGPNTGGKTVTLKTIGLLTCMACSGLNIPVAPNSSIYVFDNVFADIGDDQSISDSLSTFSSHMKNIVTIVNSATENSLILVDELGSGTDPLEGAALAISILDFFHKNNILTVATTHYQELKKYALITDGFENASVSFDINTLSPTYQLLIGVPGKSNAFAISEKLGLNYNIIQEAKSSLTKNELDFEELLKNIYDNKAQTEQDKIAISKELENIKKLKKSLERDNSNLLEQEKSIIQNAKIEARNILLDAKEEANKIISSMNNSSSSMTELNNLRNKLNKDIKNLSTKNSDIILSEDFDNKTSIKKEDLTPNLEVYIRKFNANGIIVSNVTKSNEVQVQIGSMKMSVNLKDIELLSKNQKVQKPSGTTSIKVSKTQNAKTEINVIGLNVDEAIPIIDKFLDDCSLAKLETARIVHGKGTGKLREGIHKFLRKNQHVESFRIGTFGEGEMGVTIVTIK